MMLQLLDHADDVRRKVAPRLNQKRKSELGQFMTPSTVARFMASLFPQSTSRECRLLDAGAGVGSLSCAFLDRWSTGGLDFECVEVTAYEIDDDLRGHLTETLSTYESRQAVRPQVVDGDFIEHAAKACTEGQRSFTHAILNPPYKKINSNSKHRHTLRSVGIETVNLYSAFVALALDLMAPGGQLVAIIPRSFCNGPYYRPFREFLLERAAIRHLHLFESRDKAFKDDDVLQETIIIRLERDGVQGIVTVSTSTDDSFKDLQSFDHPFERIVRADDAEHFIHVPTTATHDALELSSGIQYSLQDLGIKVSTGPVVDFRLRDHLRDLPSPGCVPLLYPNHFIGQKIEWPIEGMRKPNAIERNDDTEKWLYPNGFYTVVRRFSSKEEKRRIVASVVDPASFAGAEMLGFENHLNVFHENKQGLPELLARGLAVFLNSTVVDEHFRRFNGHTQVNATDLKQMKYPSRQALMALGEWATAQPDLTQALIDERVEAAIK